MVPPRGRLASRQTSVFVLFSRFLEMFMSGGGGGSVVCGVVGVGVRVDGGNVAWGCRVVIC